MDKQQQDDMWQNSDGKQVARWETLQYAVEYTLNQLVLIFKYVERSANMYVIEFQVRSSVLSMSRTCSHSSNHMSRKCFLFANAMLPYECSLGGSGYSTPYT